MSKNLLPDLPHIISCEFCSAAVPQSSVISTMISANYKPISDLINKLIIIKYPLSETVSKVMTFYKYVLPSDIHKSHITKCILIFVEIANSKS